MERKPKLKAGGGAKAPWMPFYGTDFYADVHVRGMSWTERGIYQFLLWTAWVEGGLPADVAELAAITNVPLREFRQHWKRLGPRWRAHPDRAGWLVNRRQEEVRSEAGELSQKMRDLALRRYAKEADTRAEAGQSAATNASPHAPPHASPQCDTACGEAAKTDAALAVPTIRHTPDARTTRDGRKDGGPLSVQVQNPEGSSTPVLRLGVIADAGDIANAFLAKVAP